MWKHPFHLPSLLRQYLMVQKAHWLKKAWPPSTRDSTLTPSFIDLHSQKWEGWWQSFIGLSCLTCKCLEPIDTRVHNPESKLSLLSRGSEYVSRHEWVLKHLGKMGPKTISRMGGRAVVSLRWALVTYLDDL